MRLRPFWATTPTRELRRSMQERTARLQRIADMSPEEYRLQAEAASMHWDWFRRQGAATEAEPQGLRDELGEGGRPGAR